jgi:hypothetical protein
MADCQGYQEMAAKRAKLKDAIATMNAKKPNRSWDTVRELGRFTREYQQIEARLYGLRWAWLPRTEVRPLYWKAEELQKVFDGERSQT